MSEINNFEQQIVANGTIIMKFFLNLSKEEQKNKSKEECYNAITPDKVFQQLNDMLKRL